MYNGVINIYKEKGFTSHDVVAKLRGICKQKKIGHTGTLDPDAEGVLLVCLGNATKLCDLLTDKRKEYVAELCLGVTTDTQDMTGEVLLKKEVAVSEEEIREVILSMQGESMQVPPMYSALKVNGKKLYELAREGITVERKARPIEIYEIEILSMNLSDENEKLVKIRVFCSKGTYVRTICHDIGQKLGCGAAMKSLLRTKVERFGLDTAMKLSEVEAKRDDGTLLEHMITVEEIFAHLDRLVVDNKYRKLIDNGNTFYPNQTVKGQSPGTIEVRVYNEDGEFYGIYAYQKDERKYKPVKMFLDR